MLITCGRIPILKRRAPSAERRAPSAERRAPISPPPFLNRIVLDMTVRKSRASVSNVIVRPAVMFIRNMRISCHPD